VAADVTHALGLGNGRDAISRLDQDGVGIADIIDSMGRTQSAKTVSEAGLYELIFQSRVPGAVEFKRWVTHEVLPQIRRTGEFRQVEVEHALPKSYADALRQLAENVERTEALEAKITADAPKVDAYDQWMDADGYYQVGAVGNILGVGRNTLYRMLRGHGVIMATGTRPYQRYAHHFVIVPGSKNGHAYETTKVRPTGIPFIAQKLGLTVRAAVSA
jgi:prophage antirepressor-like protein